MYKYHFTEDTNKPIYTLASETAIVVKAGPIITTRKTGTFINVLLTIISNITKNQTLIKSFINNRIINFHFFTIISKFKFKI